MDDLTCQELVDLVTEYLEHALGPPQRARFEAHLLDCVDCVNYVEQLRATVQIVGQLTEEDIVEPARSELIAAFRTWKQP